MGDKILVAVSGGVDSIVLLHLLSSMREEFGITLGVIHINHQLRGHESAGDERFVCGLAKHYTSPIYVKRMPPRPKRNKKSMEAFAREFRYTVFEEIRKRYGYNFIATAHHADDQVETILCRVIQGSGIGGLEGIREKRGRVIRPLLSFSRADIVKYALENKISFREDSSNKNIAFQRNYIRLKVVPLLKKMNPRLTERVMELTKNVRETNEAIQISLDNLYYSTIVQKRGQNSFVLKKNSINDLPMYLQKQLILRLMGNVESDEPIRESVWKRVEHFLMNAKTGETLEYNGWTILLNRDTFNITKRKIRQIIPVKFTFNNFKKRRLVTGIGTLHLKSSQIPGEWKKRKNIEYVDSDKLLNKQLEVRKWKSGDKMKPLGMSNYKKVSDVLIDIKMGLFEKESQLILTANNQIVWLLGVRLDNRFKVEEKTHHILKLSWMK